MYKVSSGTLNLYFVTARITLQLSSTTFVTVKNCRLVSTANHIQYKYYARYALDLTMGYARRPAAYRAAPGINVCVRTVVGKLFCSFVETNVVL